jgi:hypothetical protein
MQYLGGTIGIAMAEPIFSSQLGKNIRQYAPGAPLTVIAQSPTSIYSAVPSDLIPAVIHAYIKSLDAVFIIGVPVGASSLVWNE